MLQNEQAHSYRGALRLGCSTSEEWSAQSQVSTIVALFLVGYITGINHLNAHAHAGLFSSDTYTDTGPDMVEGNLPVPSTRWRVLHVLNGVQGERAMSRRVECHVVRGIRGQGCPPRLAPVQRA